MLSLFVGTARAQQPVLRNRLLAKVAPLTLFDPRTGSGQLGLEYRVLPSWALSADYGLQSNLLPRTRRDPATNAHYARYRADVRHYFALAAGPTWYLAAEAFYVPLRYTQTASAYHDPITGPTAYDQAHLRRNASGLSLNAGRVYLFGTAQRWQLEVFTGFGIRRVITCYYDLQNPQPTTADAVNNGWGFVPGAPLPGTEYKPHFALNFKIGYALARSPL